MSVIFTFVEVLWDDAHTDMDSWVAVGDLDLEPCSVLTVGLLLAEVKPKHIAIAQSWNVSGEVDSVLFIPVGMVRSMRVLFAGGVNGL